MIDVLELPFDQYQRYRLVADVLLELRPKGKRLRVLDVGGRTELLRAFLPHDHVFLVDLEPSPAAGLVLGDGSALPFADASVDVVAAFDTLEHVPVARRTAFVAECRRVAKSWVVLAGPYQSAQVEEAEKLLQQFLRDKLGVEHRYLEEHRHNGLPLRSAVETQLEELGARVVSIGHGNLERWLALLCMSMYMDYRPELRAIASRFHRFYNQNLYASDHAQPVYRHALVAALGKARLPRARAAAPGSTAAADASTAAPAGAATRIGELAFELVALERVRDAFELERARLLESQTVLRRDLDGHKRSLDVLQRTDGEQRAALAALTQDLAGHQRSKADLERELTLARERFSAFEREHARVRATLEQDLGQHKRQRATLAGELEQHKQHAAALEADLAAHRAVVDELRGRAAELEGELEKLRALREQERKDAQALHGELDVALEQHRAVIKAREADLEGHRAALRSALEDAQALRAEQQRLLDELGRLREEQSRLYAERSRLEGELRGSADQRRGLERKLAAQDQSATAQREALLHEQTAFADERSVHRKLIELLQRERDEQRNVLETLTHDLDEHRKVLAALGADLDGHRALVRDLRQAADLQRQLEAQLRGELEHAQERRAATQAELAAAQAQARQRDALIAQLRAELGDRWRNLKRFLGSKRPIP